MTSRIGVVALARPTFDVPFAEEIAAQAFAALDAAGIKTVGSRALMFDATAATAAVAEIDRAGIDRLLLLQVTFTDATMTVELAKAAKAPIAIWAFPEPRAGGRLRLNSFCGLNLALHALGRASQSASYLYSAPTAPNITAALSELVGQPPRARPTSKPLRVPKAHEIDSGHRAVKKLQATTIGLVGEHPAGFDTCRFDDAALQSLAGVSVARIPLDEVFARANAAEDGDVMALVDEMTNTLQGVAELDQPQLDRSMRVYAALESLAEDKNCAAMAVRCWPEMFTEYGCAACGPMAMLNGQKIPAACEADVYGALTARLLQEIAGKASWLVDIVDMDTVTNTGVFWHCGSAPLSMCDPQFKPEAQIHSNRKMPLLYQFPLKPGRITIARVSQAHNETKMIVGGGTVVRAPLSFTGTSAVVQFDGGTEGAMRGLLDHALEHHVAICYGDHQGAVTAAGQKLGLPVVALAG